MEVVVVTAMILVLTAGSLARAGRGHFNARSTVCLANQRELAGAWTAYALDHGGTLAGAGAGTGAGGSWTQGFIESTAPETFDPALSVERGQLWPYTRRVASVFRCPEDSNGRVINGQWRSRVRSYSMNLMISGNFNDGSGWNDGFNWMLYKKKSQIDGDQPAARFLFIEEHPGSINDGGLIFSMQGYPNEAQKTLIIDFPGAYHEGACALSFADEHAELHAWGDIRTSPSSSGARLSFNSPSPFNQDIRWLQERTTSARKH